MHIPDGLVSGPINAAAAAVSLAAVGFGMRCLKRELSRKEFAVPLLATTAAFVFAAQMLNFPIGGGTSGHFLGAVTAAALLGPWSACIILAVVLVIQGLFFGDGGISALGSNILNMGIIGGIGGYIAMRAVRALLPAGRGGYLASAAAASWLSVVLASSACALELAMSGMSPLMVALPAMAGTHAIIGIGEALIATAVLTAVAAARPDIIPEWANLDGGRAKPEKVRKSVRVMAAVGLTLAVCLALFGSPFASKSPDGFEKVAEKKGFMKAASEDKVVWTRALFPDYRVKSIESQKVSTSLAGFIGTIVVFGLGYAAIKLVARPTAKGEKR